MAATKDTTTSSTPKENESLLTKAARIIPGLSSSSTPQDSTTTKKPRSRGNKQHKKDQISSPLTHTAVGGQPSEGAAPATAATAAVGQQDELDLPIEDKKTSAVEACSKRIRAANKKLVSLPSQFIPACDQLGERVPVSTNRDTRSVS